MPGTYAKTACTANEAWAAGLMVLGLGGTVGGVGGLSEIPKPELQSIGVGALGGSAALAHTLYTGYGYTNAEGCWGPPKTAIPAHPPPASPPYVWTGYYYRYTLTAGAPGSTQSKDVWVWFFDRWQAIEASPTLPAGDVILDGSEQYDFSCTITGLTLCEKVTDGSPANRTSPLDFTDRTKTEAWYADEYSTVTVSGGGLSVSGPLAGAGGVLDLSIGFNWGAAIGCNHFPAANTSYGKIVSPTCFGKTADLLQTLYDPHAGGTEDEPSNLYYPGWGRTPPASGAYLKLVNDGGIALQRSAPAAWSVGTTYTGGVGRGAPITLNYKGAYAAEFEPGGAGSAMLVTAEPRSWVDGAWVADTWTFGADYSKTMMWRSELFASEWQFLSQSGIAEATQASRIVQGEDVGASAIAENDAQLGLLLQPLTLGVTGDPIWGPFLALTHAAALNVNDPPGAPARPSLWTAGSGVAVDPTNNDRWTVAAGAGSPAVSRSLVNLYEVRNDWLANHPETESYHNPDYPYILRRMRAGETYSTYGDNPAWWTARPNGEDVWNWSNYSYLRVHLTAPRSGTVTLRVTYSVPTPSDPCYEDFGHRYGHEDDGGYSITYASFVATYSVPVVSGANTVQVDLAFPAEGVVPQGSRRLCIVQTVEWLLPAAGGSPEVWTLTDLQLVHDELHTSNITHHNKRPWDWHGSNWMYLCGQVDGKPALQVHPGFLHMRQEWGLQGIQLRQHNPDLESEDDPTYAKTSARLAGELDWQEGFACTWQNPIIDSRNTDADNIALAGQMYWWDHQHQQQSSVNGAVCVGRYVWAYGVEHDLYYTGFPRGKVAGLLRQGGQRLRSTGAAWLYRCATSGGTYTRVGSFVPNTQGLWRTDAELEKGFYYGVAGWDCGATCAAAVLAVSGLQVANREYSFAGALGTRVQQKGEIGMYVQPGTMVPGFAWPNAAGDLMHRRITSGLFGVETAVTVDGSRAYVAAGATSGGSVIYVVGTALADGLVYGFSSEDGGVTWTAHGVVG